MTLRSDRYGSSSAVTICTDSSAGLPPALVLAGSGPNKDSDPPGTRCGGHGVGAYDQEPTRQAKTRALPEPTEEVSGGLRRPSQGGYAWTRDTAACRTVAATAPANPLAARAPKGRRQHPRRERNARTALFALQGRVERETPKRSGALRPLGAIRLQFYQLPCLPGLLPTPGAGLRAQPLAVRKPWPDLSPLTFSWRRPTGGERGSRP